MLKSMAVLTYSFRNNAQEGFSNSCQALRQKKLEKQFLIRILSRSRVHLKVQTSSFMLISGSSKYKMMKLMKI